MFSHVTVTAVAAPLAVVSALFALAFALYGIPRAVRSGQGSVWICMVLSLGNVALVGAFLWVVAQRVSYGIDPALFSNLLPSWQGCPTQPVQGPLYYPCDPIPNTNVFNVQMTWFALFIALIWYTKSIRVLIAELRAGRRVVRRQST